MWAEIFGVPALSFLLAFIVAMLAGFVKGVVGFAMPLIMISGFTAFLPGPVALAALILATLTSNIAQAFRDGARAAWGSLMQYRRLMGTTLVFIVLSAPLVTVLPASLFYLLLGVPIAAFALSQIMNKQLTVSATHRNRAEYLIGGVAGFFGGIAGVWGPPVIAYLLSYNTEKSEMVRVLGVLFLTGSVVLFVSHLGSGVLNSQTLPLSAAMVVPATLGMWLGFKVQDKLDAQVFRKVTQVILFIAALNLIRKGLMG